MKRRRIGWVVAGVVLAAASVAAALSITRGGVPYVPGVRVEMKNVDPQQLLRSVTVEVTGATYPLGDIGPGETKWVHVNPTGESSVIIRHGASESGRAALGVDCYMERNYSGSLQVDVTPAKIIKVNNKIGI